MVSRSFLVLFCFLLAAQIAGLLADPSRTRKSHEPRGVKHVASHDKRINTRGHKKQTRNKVQGKPSKVQSKENDDFAKLGNVLFDREQLKKYVLDYLQTHHGYEQETETITNGVDSLNHKQKPSGTHHHDKLETRISSVHTIHKHQHHSDHSLYVDHSTHKRRRVASKQKNHQPHNQHHVQKQPQSPKNAALPVYYNHVRDEDGKRNAISTGHKKQTTKYKDNAKHKANDNHMGKNGLDHTKSTKREFVAVVPPRALKLEGFDVVRVRPPSAHNKTKKITSKTQEHIHAKKSKSHKKSGEPTVRIKSTVTSSLDHHVKKDSVHKESQQQIEGRKSTVTSRSHWHDYHVKKDSVHKESQQQIEGRKTTVTSRSHRHDHHVKKDRVHKESQQQKEGRKSTVTPLRTSRRSDRKRGSAHKSLIVKKPSRVNKEFQPQKARRKSKVESKAHRNDHHAKKGLVHEKKAEIKVTRVMPRTSRRNGRKKGFEHKSSREQEPTRKSSVRPISSKSHPHKNKHHHDLGHKKSTVYKDEKSPFHRRKKTPKHKDSQKVKFSPSWKSLDKREIPSWYDDAKFGIFVHWGVYSVPSFDNEWFWYKWKGMKVPKYVNYMEKNYPPGFSYNEFAPMFTAEFFDAKQWAELVGRSGARYFVFTSKHHEGFANWNSSVAWNWNSVDIGPHRNIVDELARAFRNLSDPQVRFGLYYSLSEWFNPQFLKDKANGFKTDKYIQAVVKPQLYDLINTYKPDYLWLDGDGAAKSSYWKSQEFLAWLFNESPVKDTVVVNDRWGQGCRCRHGGVCTGLDRYNPGKLQKTKWENAMTIDRRSWGFRREADLKDYLSIEELIKQLVSTVSCGGNLLMNVGPAADGTIAPIFQERLTQMGDWLKVNGDAIYKTRPWRAQNDSVSGDVWYTSKDNHVFAIALKWPRSGKLVLGDPTSTHETRVNMLGLERNLKWTQESKHKGAKAGIVIHVPAIPIYELPCLWAWVFKLSHVK